MKENLTRWMWLPEWKAEESKQAIKAEFIRDFEMTICSFQGTQFLQSNFWGRSTESFAFLTKISMRTDLSRKLAD